MLSLQCKGGAHRGCKHPNVCTCPCHLERQSVPAAAPQRSPTERFVDLLASSFSAFGLVLSDEHRVRMEDAFNDAVGEVVDGRMAQHRQEFEHEWRD